jgi:hypothetical protein
MSLDSSRVLLSTGRGFSELEGKELGWAAVRHAEVARGAKVAICGLREYHKETGANEPMRAKRQFQDLTTRRWS